jgi:hypothetical protein
MWESACADIIHSRKFRHSLYVFRIADGSYARRPTVRAVTATPTGPTEVLQWQNVQAYSHWCTINAQSCNIWSRRELHGFEG